MKQGITDQNRIPGYLGEFFILPFDHRGTFQERFLGIRGRRPTENELAEIISFKRIIYEGYLKALAQGIPRESSGILVDEQFGAEILEDAKDKGIVRACTVEKSGQDEFEFEYGSEFREHLERFQPDFAKALVRYNPEGNSELNRRQLMRLKALSDFCHEKAPLRPRLMFELLVVATPEQLRKVQGDCSRYDREIRPELMIQAMAEVQASGIEPDLWKLEGIETEALGRRVVEQARAGNRTNVGLVILGRGEDEEKVRKWLTVAAQVPGFVGFAVGRTIFWEALKGYKAGQWNRDDAIHQIARRYTAYCELWHNIRSPQPFAADLSRFQAI